MTEAECRTILARCAAYWPHQPLPETAVLGWMDLLAEHDVELINDAVRVHAASGAEFPPPPGVLLRMIGDTQAPADWASVVGEIRAKLKELNRDRRSTYGPKGDVWETPEVTEWSDPQIAELIERSGGVGAWMQKLTIGFPGTADDTTFIAQQRNIWQAMRGRTIDHGRMQIVGAENLAALTEGPQQIGDVLKALAAPDDDPTNPTKAAA